MSAFFSGTSFSPPSPLHPSPILHSLTQAAARSSSCQGEAVLHGEAPMPLSNFTLEWSWAEHANPDITKQIKSPGWAQRRARVLRMLGWMAVEARREGSSCQPCLVWSGHPRRRMVNWLWMKGRDGGSLFCSCWQCPWPCHDGWQLKTLSEVMEPQEPRPRKDTTRHTKEKKLPTLAETNWKPLYLLLVAVVEDKRNCMHHISAKTLYIISKA